MISMYLLIAGGVPDEAAGEEHIMIGTGLEDVPDGTDMPLGALRYATTLLLASDTPEDLLDEIREWWKENADTTVELELLTREHACLSDDMKSAAAELQDGMWSFRSTFVGFSAESAEARRDAVEFIRDCAIATH